MSGVTYRRGVGLRAGVLATALAIVTALLTGVARRATPPNPPAAQPHAHWLRVVEHAPFKERDTADGFVYAGRMWLSNGYFGSGTDMYRDLWASEDGVTWTLVNDHTPYPPYSEMVAFKGAMWAIKESVWSSTDGLEWIQRCARTPFGKRGYGNVVVLHDRLWQLGSGEDVWSSPDGVNWTLATANAPYGNCTSAAVVAFRGQLWVMGGWIQRPNVPTEKRYPDWSSLNDVWTSADGVTWTRLLEHAPWPVRSWSGAAVFDQLMWIVGGFSNQRDTNLDGTWSSTDGRHWQRLPVRQPFSKRHEPAVFAFNDNLWLVAGNGWPLNNDVWKLSLHSVRQAQDAAE